MIENFLIYKTTNELKQIAKINGVLNLLISTTVTDVGDLGDVSLINNNPQPISLREILHKLCLYDISELEHLETKCDDIYHVPDKLLLINSCDRNYEYDKESKVFTIKINLGSSRNPDRDTVEHTLDYQYHIECYGAHLYVGNVNQNIKVLKYNERVL